MMEALARANAVAWDARRPAAANDRDRLAGNMWGWVVKTPATKIVCNIQSWSATSGSQRRHHDDHQAHAACISEATNVVGRR